MKDSQRKAMFAKKGEVKYDIKDGKYKINGIPIHKGQKSLAEKERLKFLDSKNKQLAHHIGTQTANQIDWRNMNRELKEIEDKMNRLDQKELDGKISTENYMRQHDALEEQFKDVRWVKYKHLNSNTEGGKPLKWNDNPVKRYS